MWHSAGNLAAYLEIGNRKSRQPMPISDGFACQFTVYLGKPLTLYWKFVTLIIKKDMGDIIVVVLVLYVFCKIVKGIFGGFSKISFRHDK